MNPRRLSGSRWLHHLLRLGAALCLGFALAAPAAAQNVLLLTTAETDVDRGATNILANLEAEFSAASGSLTVLHTLSTPGAVTAATFSAAPGPYDLVVVTSVYVSADAGNMAAVRDAIANKAAKGFYLLMDGCCQNENTNVTQLLSTINGLTGAGVTVGSFESGAVNAPLNTMSPVAGNFAAQNPLVGGWVTYMANVPALNALYLPTGAGLPGDPSSRVEALSVLFPYTQVASGAGACLFGQTDTTPFDDGVRPVGVPSGIDYFASNQGKFVPALISSVMQASGACSLTLYPPPPPDPVGTVTAVPTLGLLELLGLSVLAALAGALGTRRRRG